MKDQLIKAVNGFTKTDFWDVVGDAYTVWKPEYLIKNGFPKEWVEDLVMPVEGGEDKHRLYDNDGKSVRSIEGGVHGGLFVSRLAHHLGVDPSESRKYMGRGKVTRVLAGGILELPEIELREEVEDQSNYGAGA
jgi:hypothetical protein